MTHISVRSKDGNWGHEETIRTAKAQTRILEILERNGANRGMVNITQVDVTNRIRKPRLVVVDDDDKVLGAVGASEIRRPV